MNFTQEEKEFLVKVLSQINVAAADPSAGTVASRVQAILTKLTDPTGEQVIKDPESINEG